MTSIKSNVEWDPAKTSDSVVVSDELFLSYPYEAFLIAELLRSRRFFSSTVLCSAICVVFLVPW